MLLLKSISPIERLKGEEGQDIVEFALVLPILMVLLFGMIDFGWIFYSTAMVGNAAREGARFAVMNYDGQVTTPGDLSTLTMHVQTNVKDSLPGYLQNSYAGLTVNVQEGTTATSSDPCIDVTVTSSIKLFTPVVSTMTGSTKYTISRKVSMKKLP